MTRTNLFLIPLCLLAVPVRADETAVRRVDLAPGAVNPRGVEDGQGRIHITYGKGNDAWYVRWESGGVSDPVQVNRGVEVTIGGERGPRISVGGDGTIGVVWQNRGGVNCSLSRDAGMTWTPVTVRDPGAVGEIDSPTIGATADGNLIVAWVDGREGDREDATAALYAATLAPGGRTFGRNVRVNQGKTRVCACCAPVVASDAAGRFWVAFRGESDGVREIHLYASTDGGRSFRGGPVSRDRWKPPGCPMAGPALAVSPDGKTIAMAWRTRSRMRAALSRDAGRRFVDWDLADGATMADYPSLAIGDAGAVFLWTVDGAWRAARFAAKAKAPASFDPGIAGGAASLVSDTPGAVFLVAGD